MFAFQKDSAQFLYHYTSARTAIDHILPGENLRFSSFHGMNDPKESKNWFFIPGTNEGRDLDPYSPEVLDGVMNPTLKNLTRVLCFSKDQTLTGNHTEDMPMRGFCKPRMWAQYGGNHSGICLIFDSKRLFEYFHRQFEMSNYIRDHVVYRDRLIADIQLEPAFVVNVDMLGSMGAADYAFSHGLKFSRRMFFEKAADWANESEYRFLVFGCSDILRLDYEDSLVGIVFGQNCGEVDIADAVRVTMGRLQYQQLIWRNCTPWFDFKRTRWN